MASTPLPEWYGDGPLIDVVSNAETAGVDVDELVDVVHDQRYPETTRRRVHRIVERTLDRTDGRRAVPRTTQPRQADASPSSPPTARLTENDIEYLSAREFARLLRLVLERFGGTVDSVSADATSTGDAASRRGGPRLTRLQWNRQGVVTTVTVAPQTGRQVDAEHVQAMCEAADLSSGDADRAVIVTNGIATDEARTTATAAGARLCDRIGLANLLELARVTPTVYGDLLERGESPTFEWDDAVDRLPEPPTDLTAVDPFDEGVLDSGHRGRLSDTAAQPTDEEPTSTDRAEPEKATFSADGDTVEVNPDALGQLQTAGSTGSDDDDATLDGVLSNLTGER